MTRDGKEQTNEGKRSIQDVSKRQWKRLRGDKIKKEMGMKTVMKLAKRKAVKGQNGGWEEGGQVKGEKRRQ